MSRVGGRRIGRATREESGIYLPRGGVGGGGQYGEKITKRNLTFAILREPVAHRVVCTVAKDIFDNFFTLELEGAKEEESKAFDKLIQAELRRLRVKREATIMSVMERGYGMGIMVLGYQDDPKSLEEPLKKPTRLRQIKSYGTPQITRVELDKKEKVKGKPNPHYMLPEIYSIVRKGVTKRLRVHHSRVIHFATRYYDPNKAQWQGQSVLYDIWDDVVTLRNIRWSMGQTMFRYGGGFPVFTFTGAKRAEIQAWEDAGYFGDISTRTYFAGNEKQQLEFKGLLGQALNPEPYVQGILESISCGTGIPKAILRGAQAGALTGSEVNQMEYYGIISDEQTAYEPGLRKLIDIIRLFAVKKDKDATNKIGVDKIDKAILAVANSDTFIGMDAVDLPEEVELPAFTFNWKGGFELDEEKKQRIALTRAQELQIRGQWHTINEIRKIEDPEDQGIGDEGERLLSATPKMAEFPGAQSFHVKEHIDGSMTVTEMPKRRTGKKGNKSFLSAADDWCARQGGKWVTIKGNHICILEGETVEEAFERQTGKKLEAPTKKPKVSIVSETKGHATFKIGEKGSGDVFVNQRSPGIPEEGAGYINVIEIKQPERKKGYGSQLVNEMESYLRKKGIKRVYIRATEESIGFFEKQGYKPYGPKPSTPAKVKMWRSMMRKNLD